jgi:hypothetical protein
VAVKLFAVANAHFSAKGIKIGTGTLVFAAIIAALSRQLPERLVEQATTRPESSGRPSGSRVLQSEMTRPLSMFSPVQSVNSCSTLFVNPH